MTNTTIDKITSEAMAAKYNFHNEETFPNRFTNGDDKLIGITESEWENLLEDIKAQADSLIREDERAKMAREIESMSGEIHTPVGGYTNIVCLSKSSVISHLTQKEAK